MAIEALPNVSIGGTTKPFGGVVYNLSFNVAAGLQGENATTLTADIASEDGSYFIARTDLSTEQRYNIQIGNFTLPMFLKGYRMVVSPHGNLLQVTFIDGSFILDKNWVGLNKHVWDLQDKTMGAPPKWLIVVGTEIHPCDKNWDGVSDFKDLVDPCDPCVPEDLRKRIEDATSGQNGAPQDLSNPTPAMQAALVDCQEKARLEIFDVQYGFDDLIKAAAATTGLVFANANGSAVKSPNPKYNNKYSGRLRDVLRQWCADFGWTFFFTDNRVIFVDVTHPIQVTKTIQDFCPNIAEYVDENTLDGTVRGNLIAHFRRPGEYHDYRCEDARYIALSPYGPNSDYVIPNLAITDDIDPIAAGLALYDPYLRDLYYWFEKRKLWDSKRVTTGLAIPELGLHVLSEIFELNIDGTPPNDPFQKSVLEPSTRPEFTQGYPLDQPDTDKSFLQASNLTDWLSRVQQAILQDETFTKLFSLLPPKEQWAFAENADEYYFFLAYYDEELESEHIRDEQEFASEFMGKYYVYQPAKDTGGQLTPDQQDEKSFFEDTRIINDITKCGTPELIEDGKLSFAIKPNSNEASTEYWNAPATTVDGDHSTYSRLPFAKFLKIFRNTTGNTQDSPSYRRDNFKLLWATVNGERFFPAPSQRESGDDNKSQFPIQDKELIRQAHSYYIRKVPSKLDATQQDVISALIVGTPAIIDQMDDKVKDVTKIFLFWGRKAKEEDFQIAQAPLWYHESMMPGYKYDGEPLNQRLNDITNKSELVYKYPQLRCKDIGRWNNRAPHITFHTPVSKFGFTMPSNSVFGLIVQKEKTLTVRTERLQSFFVDGSDPTAQTLSLQVTQQDLGDDDIRNRTMTLGTCKYDQDKIKALFDERKTGLIFENTTPSIKRSISVAGALPQIPSITDGLMSIDMSIDKNEGVKTTFVLGTLNMLIPNQDIYNGLAFASPNGSRISIPSSIPRQQAQSPTQ